MINSGVLNDGGKEKMHTLGWLLLAAGLLFTFYYTIWLNWKIHKRNGPRQFVPFGWGILRWLATSALLAEGMALLTSAEPLYFFPYLVAFGLLTPTLGHAVTAVLKRV